MVQTLTADDCKALKTADRLAFHLRADGATITAVRELAGKVAGPFSKPREDVERPIHVNHGTTETAFFLVYAWHGQNGTLTALRLIIRAGDELHVRARPNNNQYCDDAGLFVDELLVTIRRNGKTVVHEFELTHSVCPNNLARAIRTA